MPAWLATFKDTLAELKGPAQKDVAAWTTSSAAARAEEFVNLIGRLDDAATCRSAHVTGVEDRAERARKADVADAMPP